ncbi:U3 small nucleolar ribonucleoprotein protein MPP10-like [Diadema setosum]|uniref:U3 small nucleolar ribonucleoprotein protein MPP10-like n=1 Tax=Diadema setosum TaxID=31175 RepID=UPI003B3BC7BD
MANNKKLRAVLRSFEGATKVPENYISCQPKHEAVLTSCTKSLFDEAASHGRETIGSSNPLSELITEGFDEEQIWQELELQNEPCIDSLLKRVAKAVAGSSSQRHARRQEMVSQGEEGETDESDHTEDEDEHSDDQDDGEEDPDESNADIQRTRHRKDGEDFDDSDESDTNFDIDSLQMRTKLRGKVSVKEDTAHSGKGRTKSSVVDDMFFKLDDMERFLEMEDAREAKRLRQMERREAGGKPGGDDDEGEEDEEEEDDDEMVDYFDDASSDEDERQIAAGKSEQKKSSRDFMYSDFFSEPGTRVQNKPVKKKVHFLEEKDKEDEDKEEDIHGGKEKEKDFDEESFEDADEDLLEELRKSSATRNKGDLFGGSSESEGEDYGDILGGPQKKRKDGGEQSSFEKRQEKLRQRISELEQGNIAEKSWQLGGEVGAAKRPENSLLEENLDFDVATRPAPIITEETTRTLEDVIKQRVLDQAWDDVQRKTKPKEEAYEFKKRITLDQEKSKLSLGEIYEQEFIKQTQQGQTEEKEDPMHADIKKSMKSLFMKLDALSQHHFTPKPVRPEVKVITNTPAISMEEVIPLTVTESSRLAPEEIQGKEKGELKGKAEKTLTDKKRELRRKKQQQRARAQERLKREKAVQKLKPGMGNKYSKKAALARLEKNSKMPSSNTTVIKDTDSARGNLKSSKAFFSKLQEEVVTQVQGLKEKKKRKKQVSGVQLKL